MADIVYVDDEPEALMAKATDEQTKRIETLIFEAAPDAEPLAPPDGKGLWLFDFFLVKPSPGNSTDENGLSLFQKWKVTSGGRPTTVLVSSDLDKAVDQFVNRVERHHVIAQRQGVEWVGDKSKDTLDRVLALADAVRDIGSVLKPSAGQDSIRVYEVERLVFDILRVPVDAEWAKSAQRQIDRARPPREISGSSEPAAARSVIAWLIAHVLPYPSFLLTDAQAALRLQITPKSFRALANGLSGVKEDDLAKPFAECLYSGPLCEFLGRRWWRAAIDDFAWQMAQGDRDYRSRLQQFAGDIQLQWLDQAEPVLLSTADLVETDEVADVSECVRVTDEDFPANVDAAWVRIDDAKRDRLLAAKVIFEDLDLLSPAA